MRSVCGMLLVARGFVATRLSTYTLPIPKYLTSPPLPPATTSRSQACVCGVTVEKTFSHDLSCSTLCFGAGGLREGRMRLRLFGELNEQHARFCLAERGVHRTVPNSSRAACGDGVAVRQLLGASLGIAQGAVPSHRANLCGSWFAPRLP